MVGNGDGSMTLLTSTCILSGSIAGPDFWLPVNQTPDRLVKGDICTSNNDNDTAQSGLAYVIFQRTTFKSNNNKFTSHKQLFLTN